MRGFEIAICVARNLAVAIAPASSLQSSPISSAVLRLSITSKKYWGIVTSDSQEAATAIVPIKWISGIFYFAK
jgi:hypothetical protein